MLQSKNLGLFVACAFAFLMIAAVSGVFGFAAYQTPSIIGHWKEDLTPFEMTYNKDFTGLWTNGDRPPNKIHWKFENNELVCSMDTLQFILNTKSITDSTGTFVITGINMKREDGSWGHLINGHPDPVQYHMIRIKSE